MVSVPSNTVHPTGIVVPVKLLTYVSTYPGKPDGDGGARPDGSAESASPFGNSDIEVADATVRCLLRAVPAAVPGIAFLSGGQPGELASARLNAMNVRFKSRLPWALAFSFARAIQQPALEIWKGEQANVSAAQRALCHRAMCNAAARRGEYRSDMEGHEP